MSFPAELPLPPELKYKRNISPLHSNHSLIPDNRTKKSQLQKPTIYKSSKMSEIHVCAIVTPAAGKESRVKEVLAGLGENVKKHETAVVCVAYSSINLITNDTGRPNTKSSSNTTARAAPTSSLWKNFVRLHCPPWNHMLDKENMLMLDCDNQMQTRLRMTDTSRRIISLPLAR